MNRRKIDLLIPRAMELIASHDSIIPRKDNGHISKTYEGYISALGPTIRFAGLKQAVLYYEGDDNRKKVIQLIQGILKTEIPALSAMKLSKYLEQQTGNQYAIKNRIYEAVIAAKLAIRTFPLDKEENDESD